jgi:hypothetical protein
MVSCGLSVFTVARAASPWLETPLTGRRVLRGKTNTFSGGIYFGIEEEMPARTGMVFPRNGRVRSFRVSVHGLVARAT